MQANGNYSYDPNGQFNGLPLGQNAADSFTYQISDGQGGTSTATVSITITGENDAPVVVDPYNPGTPPADPLRVVPVQAALDGSPITPLGVKSLFADPDNGATLTLSVSNTLPPGVFFDATTGLFS